MASDLGSVTQEMTQALDNANQNFEVAWSLIADTAKAIGSPSITNYAVSRTVSYNPLNAKAVDVNPRIQAGTTKLCEIITKNLSELQTNTNNFAQWILVGKCYLLLSDFTNAYSAFAHVLRINPDVKDKYFWYCIACVYHHFQFNEDALRFFLKISDITRDFPLYYDYHLRLGILYRDLGKKKEALQEFDIAMQNPPSGFTKDDILFQKCFTSQSISDYQNLLSKYPNNLKVIQQYMWTLSFYDDPTHMNMAKSIIDSHPEYSDDPLLKFVLARLALKSSDMETAYNRYCDCITDWCESPVFWCGLGVLYYKNEQKPDALIAFQRALYQRAEIAEAWLNLGLIFEKLGHPDNAMKIYHAGQQNCPNNQKLKERYDRLEQQSSMRNVQPNYDIEEIKDSKFFTQVGDTHALMVIRTPPAIPGSNVADEHSAYAIEELRMPYESIFTPDN